MNKISVLEININLCPRCTASLSRPEPTVMRSEQFHVS